jgi:DNA-binding CsgD family transcriptional regulator
MLTAPPGLEAYTFDVDGDEYALLVLPARSLDVPLGLSASETAVAQAAVSGKSNLEIAAERGTSVNTVANQLRSIYEKLGISGRLALIHRCTSCDPGDRAG